MQKMLLLHPPVALPCYGQIFNTEYGNAARMNEYDSGVLYDNITRDLINRGNNLRTSRQRATRRDVDFSIFYDLRKRIGKNGLLGR